MAVADSKSCRCQWDASCSKSFMKIIRDPETASVFLESWTVCEPINNKNRYHRIIDILLQFLKHQVDKCRMHAMPHGDLEAGWNPKRDGIWFQKCGYHGIQKGDLTGENMDFTMIKAINQWFLVAYFQKQAGSAGFCWLSYAWSQITIAHWPWNWTAAA